MADRPILFSGAMVRALLAGTKTQTRRQIKPRGNRPSLFNGDWSDSYVLDPGNEIWRKQDIRIEIGDRLLVRETWQGLSFGDYTPTKSRQCEVRYAATDPCADLDAEARGYPWRPSIFMPRWASRLTLAVTEVRVERLQDIKEDDAIAEGARQYSSSTRLSRAFNADWKGIYREGYAELWNSINGDGSWESNPWVVVYTFQVQHGNIDQIERAA
jgi:hypothetical protein